MHVLKERLSCFGYSQSILMWFYDLFGVDRHSVEDIFPTSSIIL